MRGSSAGCDGIAFGPVQYFVHGRDRPGSLAIKMPLNGEHWSFMDGYAEQLVARGPTLTGADEDAGPTGSLHIVDVPDLEAARRFAFEEPYYRGGAFTSVDIYGFRNLVGRTMWEFDGAVGEYLRFLLISSDPSAQVPLASSHLIVGGELLDPDDGTPRGVAALVEAPAPEAAAAMLSSAGTEVHHWSFGGRPGAER
jgi:uncharacterized protein YciI